MFKYITDNIVNNFSWIIDKSFLEMRYMMTLTRFDKAKLIAKFCKIKDRDKEGRIKSVLVPGSDAKRYRVILRRERGHLTTECLLITGGGCLACAGNTRTVCYHSIAALLVVAVEKETKMSICKNEASARKLENLGGKAYEILSRQGGNPIWIVLTKEK